MPEYNIKISELNPFVLPVKTEDYFPLVDSSSVTTFRATIQDIGQLMTHSIYADTASMTTGVAAQALFATSASWASESISASYAKTASWALHVPNQLSCSWASRSLYSDFAKSASYASHSHDSDYSTRSLDVDTHGYVYNIPYWVSNTPGANLNGNLTAYSPLSLITDEYLVYSVPKTMAGPLIIDSGSTLTIAGSNKYSPYPWFDYTMSRYNPDTNKLNKGWGPGGLQSFWPITSHTFVGTDQRFYNFWTASVNVQPWITSSNVYQFTSSYYSGSAGDATSGSWQQIPQGPGAISSSFNGKWMRIASWGGNPSTLHQPEGVASHASRGEVSQGQYQDWGGLIRIQINTSVGNVPGIGDKTNSNQIIYMFIQAGVWATAPAVQIISTNNYGYQLIKTGRLYYSSGGDDPWMALDFQLDSFSNADDVFSVFVQSWGGVRFLEYPNFGPWPFWNANADLRTLNFPIAPGHYDAVTPTTKNLNYYIQGTPVVINPTLNEMTCSGLFNSSLASRQSLHVSGGINTNTKFYCDNHAGLTTVVNYGNFNLYFSGGILVDKYPPDGIVIPPAPTTVPVCFIGICNNNQVIDDKYMVYLNGTFIGYYDGGGNEYRNDLFIGNTANGINQASQDAVDVNCKSAAALSLRAVYRFSPSILITGTNTLTMTNIQNNGYGNYGAVKVLKYNLNTSTGILTEVSTPLDTTYSGASGISFTFTFTWS